MEGFPNNQNGDDFDNNESLNESVRDCFFDTAAFSSLNKNFWRMLEEPIRLEYSQNRSFIRVLFEAGLDSDQVSQCLVMDANQLQECLENDLEVLIAKEARDDTENRIRYIDNRDQIKSLIDFGYNDLMIANKLEIDYSNLLVYIGEDFEMQIAKQDFYQSRLEKHETRYQENRGQICELIGEGFIMADVADQFNINLPVLENLIENDSAVNEVHQQAILYKYNQNRDYVEDLIMSQNNLSAIADKIGIDKHSVNDLINRDPQVSNLLHRLVESEYNRNRDLIETLITANWSIYDIVKDLEVNSFYFVKCFENDSDMQDLVKQVSEEHYQTNRETIEWLIKNGYSNIEISRRLKLNYSVFSDIISKDQQMLNTKKEVVQEKYNHNKDLIRTLIAAGYKPSAVAEELGINRLKIKDYIENDQPMQSLLNQINEVIYRNNRDFIKVLIEADYSFDAISSGLDLDFLSLIEQTETDHKTKSLLEDIRASEYDKNKDFIKVLIGSGYEIVDIARQLNIDFLYLKNKIRQDQSMKSILDEIDKTENDRK